VGPWRKKSSPFFGMIQRGGRVLLRMLANVQRKTIKPIIERAIAKGTLVFTDEYDIYSNLKRMGYEHKTVCHSKGEYARDEDGDGDGFYEVHVNTMEGVWSLLRSWLRPHRGISQEHLPFYIGFFEFVHNTRARGKPLFKSMLQIFLSPPCKPA
jgi:transposase-like protein